MGSWKTSTAAILSFLVILFSAALSLLDEDPKTNPDIGALSAAGTLAIGVFFARDNDVTSEQAGAKK